MRIRSLFVGTHPRLQQVCLDGLAPMYLLPTVWLLEEPDLGRLLLLFRTCESFPPLELHRRFLLHHAALAQAAVSLITIVEGNDAVLGWLWRHGRHIICANFVAVEEFNCCLILITVISHFSSIGKCRTSRPPKLVILPILLVFLIHHPLAIKVLLLA